MTAVEIFQEEKVSQQQPVFISSNLELYPAEEWDLRQDINIDQTTQEEDSDDDEMLEDCAFINSSS